MKALVTGGAALSSHTSAGPADGAVTNLDKLTYAQPANLGPDVTIPPHMVRGDICERPWSAHCPRGPTSSSTSPPRPTSTVRCSTPACSSARVEALSRAGGGPTGPRRLVTCRPRVFGSLRPQRRPQRTSPTRQLARFRQQGTPSYDRATRDLRDAVSLSAAVTSTAEPAPGEVHPAFTTRAMAARHAATATSPGARVLFVEDLVEAVRVVIRLLPQARVPAVHVGSGDASPTSRARQNLHPLPNGHRPGPHRDDRRPRPPVPLNRPRCGPWVVSAVRFEDGLAATVRWYAENGNLVSGSRRGLRWLLRPPVREACLTPDVVLPVRASSRRSRRQGSPRQVSGMTVSPSPRSCSQDPRPMGPVRSAYSAVLAMVRCSARRIAPSCSPHGRA